MSIMYPYLEVDGYSLLRSSLEIFLRDIVEEAGERSGGVVAHVLELGHQLVPQLLVDDGHLEVGSSQVGSL